MQLSMMDSANRDDELVAHTAPECTRLCKGEMMQIRWHAAAHQARLSQHESPVILIAQANRFPQSTDCGLVTRAMQLSMMDSANRDDELVAHTDRPNSVASNAMPPSRS
jgi:hypothetical protein